MIALELLAALVVLMTGVVLAAYVATRNKIAADAAVENAREAALLAGLVTRLYRGALDDQDVNPVSRMWAGEIEEALGTPGDQLGAERQLRAISNRRTDVAL